jgi:glycerol-3-phosphate dehydrogenase
VHGGLRYLAHGDVGLAWECAVERAALIQTVAPHLVRPLPYLIPLDSAVGRGTAAKTLTGLWAADALRGAAGTSRRTLPRARRVSALEARRLAPALREPGLRGALLGWDGQLEDDARLVTTIARTAASYGAHVRTRSRVLSATGTAVELRDELTGEATTVTARAVVNATGVWAGHLVEEVSLRPSRGTHLVLRAETFPGLRVAVTAPVPGESSRFVLVLPQPDGTIYIGLTDEPVDADIPDVPTPSEPEIGFLLDVVSAAFARDLRRTDVVGAYAGLRPLLDAGDGSTADLSRRHAVLTSASGVVTIVGGKLTTYRRMAEDALDAALGNAGIAADPCRTRTLPLTGAAPRDRLARLELPARLVRRYGTDAGLVLASAREVSGLGDDELLAPLADNVPATLAELLFGVTHEGAADVDDLLDRRTRIGLVPADRDLARPAAERALSLAAHSRQR